MYFEGELYRSSEFYFKCLTSDDLNISSYLEWMRNTNSNPFIEATNPQFSFVDLMAYINNVNSDPNSISIGFFDLSNGKHVGNIKFHNINREERTAFLGILIGDESYRGKSKAVDILLHSMYWISNRFFIKTFYLGVSKENLPAVKSYLKAGFIVEDRASNDLNYIMSKLL